MSKSNNPSIKSSQNPAIKKVESSLYSGPTPPASELKALNDISPELLDRVISLAEKSMDLKRLELEHKIEIETQNMNLKELELKSHITETSKFNDFFIKHLSSGQKQNFFINLVEIAVSVLSGYSYTQNDYNLSLLIGSAASFIVFVYHTYRNIESLKNPDQLLIEEKEDKTIKE